MNSSASVLSICVQEEKAMKYQGPEWHEAVKAASLTDKTYKANARGFTARWQNLLLGCPGGVDKLVDWDVRNGEVVSVTLQEKPSPSDFAASPFDKRRYLSRFIAPYSCFVRLHKQELTPMVAIGSGEYEIVGSITEVMKKIEQIDAFVDLTSTVPAEYDETHTTDTA
jgi:hypothetical protein